MARRERHFIQFADIPGADDQAARIGIGLDGMDQTADLIYWGAISSIPAPPLSAIHGAQFSIFVRPLIPDIDAPTFKKTYIGISL